MDTLIKSKLIWLETSHLRNIRLCVCYSQPVNFYLSWICYGVCLNEKLFVFRYVVFHETLCKAETIWNDCECLEKITIISTVTLFYLIPWFLWWRRRMKTLSALFALREDDPSMTVGFPHTGLLMQNVMFSSPLSWHAVEQTVATNPWSHGAHVT